MDYDEKITLLESVSDLEQAETWNKVQQHFMLSDGFVYEMEYFNIDYAFREPLEIAEIGQQINTADPYYMDGIYGLESGELHNLIDWSMLDDDLIDYACEVCGIEIDDEEEEDDV